MDKASRQLFDEQLPAIHGRLLATAVRLVRRTRWKRSEGDTVAQMAKDLLQEAVLRTLRPESRVWKPSEVELEPFLVMTMKSLLHAQEASPAAKRTEYLEDGPARASTGTPEEQAMTAQACKSIVDHALDAANGDEDLEAIVLALADGHEKSAEVAEETGMPVERVYTAVRTLRRRLRRKEVWV